MEEPIRIIIADDHTLFREGLVALLDSVADIQVLAAVEDGQQVIEAAAKLAPDVILMDLQMPKVNGIEATRKIIESNPRTGVIVVTMFEDDDSVFAAMRAGARGYILKGADQNDVIRAIQAVARGEALFGPSVATRIMSYFTQPVKSLPQTFSELTQRESEILEAIAKGLNNAQIAENLSISQKTVRNHVSNIFNKLQVTDRVQAVLRVREAGMGQDS